MMKNIKNCVIIMIPFFLNSFQMQQTLSKITIKEIYDFGKDIAVMAVKAKVVKLVSYQSFNFSSLEPINSSNVSHDDYFKIGYDSFGKVIKVYHFEKESRLGNFEMDIYHHEKFKIATLIKLGENCDTSSVENKTYLKGLFVLLTDIKKIYFINTVRQYDNNCIFCGGVDYESSSFSLGNFQDISVVMLINANFYPEYIFRISFNRLLFVSFPVYDSKNFSLLSETLLAYNCAKNFEIREQTQLKDFDDIIEKNCLYPIAKVIPSINPECSHLPLWLNSGIYYYEFPHNKD